MSVDEIGGPPVKTMAEVILLHSNFGRDGQGQYCKACNYRYGYGTGRELKRRASDHIAAALAAAGYGPVKEARAGAWDEGVCAYKAWMWDDDGIDPLVNPYRAATKDDEP